MLLPFRPPSDAAGVSRHAPWSSRRSKRRSTARAEPCLTRSWQQREARKPRPRTVPEPAWVTLLRVVIAETPADHRLSGLGCRYAINLPSDRDVALQAHRRTAGG